MNPEGLKSWQRSAIRNTMANYRRAQEDYYVHGKRLAELENGAKAFSLLTPPLGSAAARRRVRIIMENMLQSGGPGGAERVLPPAARTPHVMTVAVTYNCQCACRHCSAASYQKQTLDSGSALTFEELRNAIGQALDMGTTCVVLTGGEPLLFERIYDLVASVDASRGICTLFTNGEFLREHAVERLKNAGIFGVFVSFDDADAERHDQHRGRPGLARKAARGLDLCRQAGILTGISTYATREKIASGELDEMMELARELDVLEVFLFDVIPTGRLAGHHECMLDDGDVEQVRAFRERYTAKPDYPRIIHQTMFASIAYPCVAEGCPAGMVQVHLRANGDVAPCDFTPRSFGNIRQRPLAEIWGEITRSSLYEQFSPRCRLSRMDFWTQLERAGQDGNSS
jgi:MoaA/NifB/PqqE/SkfB family radical SAM enzyme